MSLRGWSWDAVAGPAGAGDRPLLEALEVALPDAAVEEAIARTGTRERRRRRLPTHLVVTLVVAMGLWAEASVRHALAAVVDGWAETRARRAAALGPPAGAPAAPARWRLPSTAALVRARRRAGVRLFRELFHAVAGPIATPATPGAFLGGLRLMAIDGTTLDVADTPENARAFGRPTTHRGAGAFPQLRAVALIETGTHALCDVVLRPFRGGEAPAARHLLRAVGPGMLLLWDRGFHGYELIQRTLARGAHFLGRTKTNVVLPPAEGLPDGSYLSAIYPSPTARRRREGGLVVRVVEYALDTPAGPGTERYRLLTSLLDAGGLPRPDLGGHVPRAVGGGDRPGRGEGAPVGPPPPPAQPAPAGGGAGGLRPAAGPPGRPHPDVPGRPPRRGRPRPAELHRGPAGAAPGHPPRPAHGAQAPPPFADWLLTELAAERLPPRRPRRYPRQVRRKMSNYPRKRPPSAPAPATAPVSVRILSR